MGTYTLKHGTSKKSSVQKSASWGESVTGKVQSSMGVKGVNGESAEVDSSISQSQAESYSSEWSMSEEETFSITFKESYEGKALFQWQFFVDDSYGSSTNP